MTVQKVQIDNKCGRDVYVYGRQSGANVNHRIPAMQSETFTEAFGRGFIPWRNQRMIFSFADVFQGKLDPVTESQTTVELNANYNSYTVPKSHINFIGQQGFSDLTLEVALWKDHIGGALACDGSGGGGAFSRAKTIHKTSECSFGDGSGQIVQSPMGDAGEEDETFSYCQPMCPTGTRRKPSDPRCLVSCFSDKGPTRYAEYSSTRALAWVNGHWMPSPPTINYHLRAGGPAGQWSAIFECWDNQAGPEGFLICDMPDVLGVWQVVTCPADEDFVTLANQTLLV